MADTDRSKKKAQIIAMMHGYPGAQSQITEGTVNAYLVAVADCSLDAVTRSCGQFLSGKVESHNNAYLPTAAELAANAASWDSALGSLEAARSLKRMVVYPVGTLPPPPLKPLGPIKMEIEGIMRDTSSWSYEEKMEAMTTGKMPASRQIGSIGKKVTARLQKMTDK